MSRILSLLLSLCLVASCSSQPKTEETTSSCNTGDCAKNLNKLSASQEKSVPSKGKDNKKKVN